MFTEMTYKHALNRGNLYISPHQHASSIGYALYSGIQFFLLTKANFRVHAVTTHISSLKEDTGYSIINLSALRSYS